MTRPSERPLPGGPLAIDLLNTTWQSRDEIVDWLDTDSAVRQFAAEYGHSITQAEAPRWRAALVRSREITQRLLESTNASSNELTSEVNAVLAAARAVVVPTEAGPRLAITGEQPHDQLAVEALVNAIELRTASADRLRCCEHESCVLWFLDTSKAGRRRWCSMERCGNRSKAKRHYQRKQASPATPGRL